MNANGPPGGKPLANDLHRVMRENLVWFHIRNGGAK